ncbi:MAG: Gfo/Idh/MocA family oxidoreductase [Saprospiraceae bacterium]|nr:Gfo/Idh/MocA family oxidoreductase [Saprospiraceae bacterium]
MKENTFLKRRDFMKHSSLAAGALMTSPLIASGYGFHNSVNDEIKVAVVGCGGRGSGAATQALKAASNVRLVAMCDAFEDRLQESLNSIKQSVPGDRVDVPEDRQFVGFEGYKQAIALCDVIILTTPPAFRPVHFAEAIKQNKHVFMEKPVSTDAAGVRSVLKTAQEAKQKKLNVVVGLQRHYQTKYKELMAMVHKGKIGDVTSGQVYWNGAGVWVRPREAQQTEMEYQMRNWYYFTWLCGDHIVEQHIHNLDVMNWAKNGYPVKAQGMGGREVRKGKDHGQIFDHHFVEFTYADGSVMNSQCRHIKNCWNQVNETITGTKGRVDFGAGSMTSHNGRVLMNHDDTNDPNPYQVEHDELFAAINKGEYKFADADNGAKSTMTSIMGRMATYSGQMLSWDDVLNSKVELIPASFTWNDMPPARPDADGNYPVAVPGSTSVV